MSVGAYGSWRWLPAALLLCALIYWPGLHGGFIFDDFPFLVENTDVHVTSLQPGDWIRAAMSFPATHQGRWLTMLTLAANHWTTGLDPFWFKLTNLFIHLLNGALLYFALDTLLRLCDTVRGRSTDARLRQWAVLAITACWLVLPINLTAVLYAIQRLESFSNTFVFAGLLWYLRARLRYAAEGRGIGHMAAALVVCTGVGVLAKESAVLLPLYTACVEFFALGLRDAQGRWRGPVLKLYAALLVVPLLGGLYWLATWLNTPSTYVRTFSTLERLLTEGRVLVQYIAWTLLPTPKVASLYHDDIAVSTGLLTPPATLLSLLLLAALAAAAFLAARTRPLLALGLAWFFAAHMLTATIIPLELVFEHRNYFASVGLLLALAALLALEPLRVFNPRLLALVSVALLGFYGLQTALRAREWSHPLKLALAEASNNPQSPRASYEFARALMVSAQASNENAIAQRVMQALDNCTRLPNAGILCAQGAIFLSAQMDAATDPKWWQDVHAKLAARPPTEADIDALTVLVRCRIDKLCPASDDLGAALQAAQRGAPGSARLSMIHARYAWHVAGDTAAAEALMRKSVSLEPQRPAYRAFLIELLVETGQLDAARQALAELRALDYVGSLDYMTVPLQRLIELRSTTPSTTQ